MGGSLAAAALVGVATGVGNDVNARADFGDYEMTGEPACTLLYYPHKLDALVDLGVGDPRRDESTALHGSVIAGQPSITRYLLEQGADPDPKNALGWTPLMMPRGIFPANASREFAAVEAVLLEVHGMSDSGSAGGPATASAAGIE